MFVFIHNYISAYVCTTYSPVRPIDYGYEYTQEAGWISIAHDPSHRRQLLDATLL